MDITLLNVDKNNKIIRTNHKSIENQINHFINTWKKTKIYQTKTFTATIVQENHSLITIIPLDNNHLTEITIAEDLQIKEFQKNSHKIDIVDQTVKLISLEIIIQDQTRTQVTTQITIGINHTQTTKLDIIQTTVLQILHTTESEITQTIGIDNTQITDQETNQTNDQTKIIITKNHVTILRTKVLTTQIEKEIKS